MSPEDQVAAPVQLEDRLELAEFLAVLGLLEDHLLGQLEDRLAGLELPEDRPELAELLERRLVMMVLVRPLATLRVLPTDTGAAGGSSGVSGGSPNNATAVSTVLAAAMATTASDLPNVATA